jgi:hypothetical protein
MTHEQQARVHYQAIARRMSGLGYRVIVGYGKGGFWVRNPDMTKPAFADEHSFVSIARARMLFMPDRQAGVALASTATPARGENR